VWSATTDGATFGDVAKQVARALDDAGYRDARRYPIGVDFVHGFAIVTRLERIESDGSAARDRWSALYAEPSTLRWLEGARDPQLPREGRFRVFLVAFSDLPFEGAYAPRWNEQTLMDAPGLPTMRFPLERAATASFRMRAFVYEYAAGPSDEPGTFLASDDALSAAAHVRGARLMALGGSP
jgi:hypothetical protein